MYIETKLALVQKLFLFIVVLLLVNVIEPPRRARCYWEIPGNAGLGHEPAISPLICWGLLMEPQKYLTPFSFPMVLHMLFSLVIAAALICRCGGKAVCHWGCIPKAQCCWDRQLFKPPAGRWAWAFTSHLHPGTLGVQSAWESRLLQEQKSNRCGFETKIHVTVNFMDYS